MSENTEQDKENTDTTENEDNKKYPNVYVSIAVASIIIASPFIIYNYFIKSSASSSTEMPKMPEMPNMQNPFATTEIESKLTSIQDAMSKMENKMDEVDKKVTDLYLVRLHPDAEEKNYELIKLPDLTAEIRELFAERRKEIMK